MGAPRGMVVFRVRVAFYGCWLPGGRDAVAETVGILEQIHRQRNSRSRWATRADARRADPPRMDARPAGLQRAEGEVAARRAARHGDGPSAGRSAPQGAAPAGGRAGRRAAGDGRSSVRSGRRRGGRAREALVGLARAEAPDLLLSAERGADRAAAWVGITLPSRLGPSARAVRRRRPRWMRRGHAWRSGGTPWRWKWNRRWFACERRRARCAASRRACWPTPGSG